MLLLLVLRRLYSCVIVGVGGVYLAWRACGELLNNINAYPVMYPKVSWHSITHCGHAIFSVGLYMTAACRWAMRSRSGSFGCKACRILAVAAYLCVCYALPRVVDREIRSIPLGVYRNAPPPLVHVLVAHTTQHVMSGQ